MTNISPATIASAITSPQTSASSATTATAAAVPGDTATSGTGSGGTGKTALNADFETFLKMLTVQAQNQDPLNPMDSTEYAAQLAAFSSVEQQVQTNDLLSGLDKRFGSMGLAQMANWVGMEARVEAPVSFSGQPLEILPKFETLADSATLVVKDQNGTEVQRLTVDPKAETLAWTGIGSDGTTLPSGLYSLATESYAAGKLLQSHPAQAYTRIDEIQNQDGVISLVLAGGGKIDAALVTALRDAKS